MMKNSTVALIVEFTQDRVAAPWYLFARVECGHVCDPIRYYSTESCCMCVAPKRSLYFNCNMCLLRVRRKEREHEPTQHDPHTT